MKTIEDLDQGTIRRIDWQELIPGVLLLRALYQSFRVVPILSGTLFALLLLVLTDLQLPVSDSAILFSSLFRIPHLPNWVGGTIFILLLLFYWIFTARRLSIRLVSTERFTRPKSFGYAYNRLTSVYVALLIPLAGIFLCHFFLFVLYRNISLFQALMPISLGIAFLYQLLTLGLALGLPLFVSAAAVDGCDGFDAFSRAFSYLFRNLFHTIFYYLLAVLFGAAGYFLLRFFTVLTTVAGNASIWTGIDGETAAAVNNWSLFWWTGFTLLPCGFIAVYVPIAGSALYLILRRTVDGIPFDRFSRPDEGKPHHLRPILADETAEPSHPAESDQKGEAKDGDEPPTPENGSESL